MSLAQTKPVIAVDIDEVLGLLHEPIITYHNQVYGTGFVPYDPIGTYYLSEFAGYDHARIQAVMADFMLTEGFTQMAPLPGAVEALSRLAKDYGLVVVTARWQFMESETREWLNRHFPGLFQSIHFSEHITGQGMKVPKSEFCQQVGAEILIDDNLGNAEECAAAGIRVLLFGDYPWNKADQLPEGVERVSHWQQVLERLYV